MEKEEALQLAQQASIVYGTGFAVFTQEDGWISPHPENVVVVPCKAGLTSKPLLQNMELRDWLAAQALTGLCSGNWHSAESGTSGFRENISSYAALSYEVADAMLAARLVSE